MANVNVLMTVYNEETFLPYAIRSCLPHVKTLTIVEGAYRETIAVGAPPRSTDNTIKIAKSFLPHSSDPLQFQKVTLLHANEKSDLHQRNIGLEAIKKTDPNGWLLIIDGDEVYEPITFKMIEALTKKMDNCGARAAYFKSLTFVNDLNHYCEQEFPRLFKLTPECQFVNDNYMWWDDKTQWGLPTVIKAPNIRFFHYSFCKGSQRFALKKKWWETRFQQPFNYSWHFDETGNIADKGHQIMGFTGQHPPVMADHPLR